MKWTSLLILMVLYPIKRRMLATSTVDGNFIDAGRLCGIISRKALLSVLNKATKPTAAELVTNLTLLHHTSLSHSRRAVLQRMESSTLPKVEWKVDLTPCTHPLLF